MNNGGAVYLSIGRDLKTIKGESKGILTGILYLSPASLSGVNLCPYSSKGCRASCLYISGASQRFPKVNDFRLQRTKKFSEDKRAFLKVLYFDILTLKVQAGRLGLKPSVRLNGTTDINWQVLKHEGLTLFEHFPEVSFYDYTKNFNAVSKFENYSLTFSRSENTKPEHIKAKIKTGQNVAVVFYKVPATWEGLEVINGDEHDHRPLDKRGVVVGLKAKGRAKREALGFVVR